MTHQNEATIQDVLEAINTLSTHIDERFLRVETRLDRVEERLDKIETRLDRVEERLDKIEVRLDRVEDRLVKVETRLDRVEDRLVKVETRLDGVEIRLEVVERTMVTKDYLDEKVYDSRTEMTGFFRKENQRTNLIVDKLQEKNVLTGHDVREIDSVGLFMQRKTVV